MKKTMQIFKQFFENPFDAIIDAITKNQVSEIILTKDDATEKNIKQLAKALKVNKSVRLLCLQGAELGDKLAAVLIDGLIGHPTIEAVYLQSNNLTDVKLTNLNMLIERKSALRELNLADNQLNDDAVITIAKSLEKNDKLATLSLYHNLISNKSVAALAHVLKINKSIVSLSLDSNYITENAVELLGAALQVNTTLKKLFLGNNALGQEGGQCLIKAMEKNFTLQVLDIYENKLQLEQELALETFIERNHLHLQQQELMLAKQQEQQLEETKRKVAVLNSAKERAKLLLEQESSEEIKVKHTQTKNNIGTTLTRSYRQLNLNQSNLTKSSSSELELDANLKEVLMEMGKAYIKDYQPSCFVSYSWNSTISESAAKWLERCLTAAGFFVHFDLKNGPGNRLNDLVDKIEESDFIVVLCSKKMLEKYQWKPSSPQDIEPVVRKELNRINIESQLASRESTIIPILLEGTIRTAMPAFLRVFVRVENFAHQDPIGGLFALLQSLYKIQYDDPIFSALCKQYIEATLPSNSNNNNVVGIAQHLYKDILNRPSKSEEVSNENEVVNDIKDIPSPTLS